MSTDGEWLADFHFQENVSLIIWTLRNSGIAQTQLRTCDIAKFCAKWLLRLIAQNLVVSHKYFTKRKQILRSVPQKVCERKKTKESSKIEVNSLINDYRLNFWCNFFCGHFFSSSQKIWAVKKDIFADLVHIWHSMSVMDQIKDFQLYQDALCSFYKDNADFIHA